MSLFTHASDIEVKLNGPVGLRRVEREVTTSSAPLKSTHQILAIIDTPAKSIRIGTEVAGIQKRMSLGVAT